MTLNHKFKDAHDHLIQTLKNKYIEKCTHVINFIIQEGLMKLEFDTDEDLKLKFKNENKCLWLEIIADFYRYGHLAADVFDD